jgi:hypothetical protein
MTTAEFLAQLRKGHGAVFGMSGSGKSVFLQQCADGLAKDPLVGFTFMCPHGTARLVAERLSNPARAAGRVVHVLDFSSGMAWGANPFETGDPKSWEACHEASLLWTSSVESLYATAMHQTPRLETTCYVIGMFGAAKDLTLNELLPAISLAGERIREFLLSDFDNHAVRAQLEDLHLLASRNPRQFLELLESFRNRTVRWLGDKRLARLLGKHKGLDAKAIMDGKEIVLIDLASLPAEDAAFVMTLLVCRYFAAAKRRAADTSAPHQFIIDEAANGLCTATGQMLDQTRKFGLCGLFSFQRIGQLREKGDSIIEAVMANTGAKVVFAMPEPRSARFLAEMLFTPHLDYAEWVAGSERPTPVGNELRTVHNRSRAEHRGEHHATAMSDMRSQARASSMTEAHLAAWGSVASLGTSASLSATAPTPVLESPTPLSTSRGETSARSSSLSAGRSSARSYATQSARTQATTHAHGTARATSLSVGESEQWVTVYKDLPTKMYSVEEQLTRLTGEIMGLQPRECFIKLPYRAPFRIRTQDLAPAYRSLALREHMLPRFLANAAAASPYLAPVAEVDAEIAARAAEIASPPAPPQSDASAPIPNATPLDNALDYADGFRRRQTPNKNKLRLIDGGVNDGDKQP